MGLDAVVVRRHAAGRRGSAEASTCSEMHRWASARLAKLRPGRARPRSRPASGAVRKAWTPVATSRPSTRRARSLLACVGAGATPGSGRPSTGAGGRVDDDDLAGEAAGPARADPLLRAHRVGAAARDHRREPGQGLERGRAAGAVGRDPDVALELPHRPLGVRAEAPVDPADLEAELEEAPLQGDDVVAGLQAARAGAPGPGRRGASAPPRGRGRSADRRRRRR